MFVEPDIYWLIDCIQRCHLYVGIWTLRVVPLAVQLSPLAPNNRTNQAASLERRERRRIAQWARQRPQHAPPADSRRQWRLRHSTRRASTGMGPLARTRDTGYPKQYIRLRFLRMGALLGRLASKQTRDWREHEL